MQRDHAGLFFSASEWLLISAKVRRVELDPFQGYARFFDLSREKKMRSCGPAYDTKLLFFPPPPEHPRGVSWINGRRDSVNLLLGRSLVKLAKGQKGVSYVQSRYALATIDQMLQALDNEPVAADSRDHFGLVELQ